MKLPLWPAASVAGVVIPVTVKPVPLTATAEIVMLAFPVFVTVSDAVGFCPSCMLPKFMLVGLAVSAPAGAVDPVPLSATVVCASEASLAIVIVAANGPVELGENTTLIVALCPAAIEAGRVGDVMEKYLVENVTLPTVTDAVPEFVAVTVTVLLPPGATLPKSTDVLSREIVPTVSGAFAALTPWQPAIMARLARSRSAPAAFPRVLAEFPVACVFGIMVNRPFPQVPCRV